MGRMEAIDRLLDCQMPLPADWTQAYPVFGLKGIPKMTESIWHLSDAGLYILSLTDITEEYKGYFVRAIQALRQLLDKVHLPHHWDLIHKEIAEALATLEIKLPLFWCTATRHHLLHAVEKIKFHGSFWAQNMLPEERMHIKLRGMSANPKHILGSIATNYALMNVCQASWRLDQNHVWSVSAGSR